MEVGHFQHQQQVDGLRMGGGFFHEPTKNDRWTVGPLDWGSRRHRVFRQRIIHDNSVGRSFEQSKIKALNVRKISSKNHIFVEGQNVRDQHEAL